MASRKVVGRCPRPLHSFSASFGLFTPDARPAAGKTSARRRRKCWTPGLPGPPPLPASAGPNPARTTSAKGCPAAMHRSHAVPVPRHAGARASSCGIGERLRERLRLFERLAPGPGRTATHPRPTADSPSRMQSPCPPCPPCPRPALLGREDASRAVLQCGGSLTAPAAEAWQKRQCAWGFSGGSGNALHSSINASGDLLRPCC